MMFQADFLSVEEGIPLFEMFYSQCEARNIQFTAKINNNLIIFPKSMPREHRIKVFKKYLEEANPP